MCLKDLLNGGTQDLALTLYLTGASPLGQSNSKLVLVKTGIFRRHGLLALVSSRFIQVSVWLANGSLPGANGEPMPPDYTRPATPRGR